MSGDHTFYDKFWIRSKALWLMGITLLSACLSSCSGSATGIATPSQQPSVSSTKLATQQITLTPTATVPPITPVDPKTLNGITISFWHPWSGSLQEEVDAITAEFNETNVWGIRVSTKKPGGSGVLFEKLMDGLKTDELPDIFATTTNQILELQEKTGDIVNLDSYIHDEEWGLNQQEIADYALIFWNSTLHDHKRLGIPAHRDIQVLFYNETWANELGFFTPPDNPTTFRQQACSAAKANAEDKEKANNGTGGWIINADGLSQLSWMMAFGDQKIPSDESETYHFDTPENQELYSYMRTLFDNNCAWVSRDPSPYQYFATRSALFYSGKLEDILPQMKAQTAAGSSDQWKVIPYPTEEGKPVILSSGTSYAMLNSNPEKQLAAWLFMRWMILPRNQAKVVKSTGQLPVTHSISEELVEFKNAYPQWGEALMWVPMLTEAPTLPSWRLVEPLVEDSVYQVFQGSLKPEEVPEIPRQLDLMITDVIKHH